MHTPPKAAMITRAWIAKAVMDAAPAAIAQVDLDARLGALYVACGIKGHHGVPRQAAKTGNVLHDLDKAGYLKLGKDNRRVIVTWTGSLDQIPVQGPPTIEPLLEALRTGDLTDWTGAPVDTLDLTPADLAKLVRAPSPAAVLVVEAPKGHTEAEVDDTDDTDVEADWENETELRLLAERAMCVERIAESEARIAEIDKRLAEARAAYEAHKERKRLEDDALALLAGGLPDEALATVVRYMRKVLHGPAPAAVG